jgi:ABC-2 type transport system permease protein
VLAGPGGIDVLIVGKFLYLVLQGTVQVGVIFAIAWLGYGVPVPAKLGPWLLVTGCGALAAAGLAMLLVSASATRRQAQTVSTLAILVLSAVGGSMVPRYVMPPSFQSLGWLTPNTWAVEAYRGIFWYEETLAAIWQPCAILTATGLLALALAVLLARRGVSR